MLSSPIRRIPLDFPTAGEGQAALHRVASRLRTDLRQEREECLLHRILLQHLENAAVHDEGIPAEPCSAWAAIPDSLHHREDRETRKRRKVRLPEGGDALPNPGLHVQLSAGAATQHNAVLGDFTNRVAIPRNLEPGEDRSANSEAKRENGIRGASSHKDGFLAKLSDMV